MKQQGRREKKSNEGGVHLPQPQKQITYLILFFFPP
jgi:hypothetical protein